MTPVRQAACTALPPKNSGMQCGPSCLQSFYFFCFLTAWGGRWPRAVFPRIGDGAPGRDSILSLSLVPLISKGVFYLNEMILLKQGEMVLKGLNRRTFEDKLIANAQRKRVAWGEEGQGSAETKALFRRAL